MQRVQVRFATVLLLVLSAPICMAADHGAELSGTVRDEHGVPQMGAVIELIGATRGSVRTAVTGLDGRYVFANLLTGTYRVRASASFFRPLSTRGLRVGPGMQAVVDLTLANMYSAATLLPAERRSQNEADDDWMWTMRSAASRPVLRLAAGTIARPVEAGSSDRRFVPVAMATSVESARFGGFGVVKAAAMEFRSADGTREASVVTRLGAVSHTEGTPIDVRVVTSRRSSPWSSTSTAVSFESNPAVRPVVGGASWRSLRAISAETASFGDTAALEVGTMLTVDSSQPGKPANRPFGRVRVFLPGSWTVDYALATDRSLQRASDAVSTSPSGFRDGAERTTARIEHGRHQAVVLSQHGKMHSVAVGFYRDTLERTPMLGSSKSGTPSGILKDLGLLPGALVDSSNMMFQAEGPRLITEGCHAVVSQQLASDAWIELRFASGAGLETTTGGSPVEGVTPRIRVGRGVAAGVAAHTRVRRTGTLAWASYEWQPERIITPVDAFERVGVPAYLGFTVEQAVPVWLAPRGTVVHISAGNVLRQGLREVSGRDQSVAILAQELPTLQAGVGFTF